MSAARPEKGFARLCASAGDRAGARCCCVVCVVCCAHPRWPLESVLHWKFRGTTTAAMSYVDCGAYLSFQCCALVKQLNAQRKSFVSVLISNPTSAAPCLYLVL